MNTRRHYPRGTGLFDSFKQVYIMFVVHGEIAKGVKDRRSLLLNSPYDDGFVPHLTAMEVLFNTTSSYYVKIQQSWRSLCSALEDAHKKAMKDIVLQSTTGEYEMLGRSKIKFASKQYTANDSEAITRFRKRFYGKMAEICGVNRMDRLGNWSDVNGNVFIVYGIGNEPIIAVPDYYHGTGKWTAHLSIANTKEIENKNSRLSQMINGQPVNIQARQVTQWLSGRGFARINRIEMSQTTLKIDKIN